MIFVLINIVNATLITYRLAVNFLANYKILDWTQLIVLAD